MNILRVRQAAAREDRIAFKLSGRLATSAPAPTCCAHGRAHAQRMRNAVSRSPMCKREQSNGGENTAVPFLVFIFLPRNCGQPSRTLYPSALLSRAYFLVFPFSPSPPPPLFLAPFLRSVFGIGPITCHTRLFSPSIDRFRITRYVHQYTLIH